MWLFSVFGLTLFFTFQKLSSGFTNPKYQERIGNPRRKRLRWYFSLLYWLELQQHEEQDLGKGDVIQRRWVRWVFSNDGSCWVTLTAASVCLQLWINRLEARESVLVEGDTHSCGAANIGAGSCWGEGAGGNQASRPFHRRPASMCLLWCLTGASRYFVYPPRETQTSAPPFFLRKSEVRGSSPEAGKEFRSRLWHIYPKKNAPFTHNWSELAGQKNLLCLFTLLLSHELTDATILVVKGLFQCVTDKHYPHGLKRTVVTCGFKGKLIFLCSVHHSCCWFLYINNKEGRVKRFAKRFVSIWA